MFLFPFIRRRNWVKEVLSFKFIKLLVAELKLFSPGLLFPPVFVVLVNLLTHEIQKNGWILNLKLSYIIQVKT